MTPRDHVADVAGIAVNVNLTISGPATWTHHALDHYLAPKLSKFSAADIASREELSQRAQYWPRDLSFLSVFYSRLVSNWVRYGDVFVRRASAAVRHYELARVETAEFLAKHKPSQPALSVYVRAVDDWEVFLANSEQAMKLLGKVSGLRRFAPGDCSELERLNKIHATSKHRYRVARQDDSPAQAAFPIWMTTKGLESRDSVVTWTEAAETIDFFGQVVAALMEAIVKPGEVQLGVEGAP